MMMMMMMMMWVERVARMGGIRNAYKNVVGKHEG
jgi:hypothetical protein